MPIIITHGVAQAICDNHVRCEDCPLAHYGGKLCPHSAGDCERDRPDNRKQPRESSAEFQRGYADGYNEGYRAGLLDGYKVSAKPAKLKPEQDPAVGHFLEAVKESPELRAHVEKVAAAINSAVGAVAELLFGGEDEDNDQIFDDIWPDPTRRRRKQERRREP